jgi:hypothetical protein
MPQPVFIYAATFTFDFLVEDGEKTKEKLFSAILVLVPVPVKKFVQKVKEIHWQVLL